MIDSFLFIALPYIAIIVCVVGSIYRTRNHALSYSALSSQFLEGKSLVWGSVPWHIGIITLLVGHLIVLFCPQLWQTMVSSPSILWTVEAIGLTLGFACLAGLIVLFIRRVTSTRVQAVTSPMDLLVLTALLVQVVLGIGIAMQYRWGSSWATGTMSPYVWSLLTLQPNISLIQDMPVLVKAHIVVAWLFLALIPCSRLIHMFALPVHYLLRPPQNVVWNNARRAEAMSETIQQDEGRRFFLRGAMACSAGLFLLSIGVANNVFRFFFGPRLTKEEESEMMSTRLKRLTATTDQRKLELERQQSNYIFIAALADLSAAEGKYFIDYEMRPGLAFKGKDGMPNLLSAKCTHLGCTVGNQVNAEGQILCPCHVSYFSIESGQPNAGAPAKEPLPHLSWVVMDDKDNILASCKNGGKPMPPDASAERFNSSAKVYLVRDEENRA